MYQNRTSNGLSTAELARAAIEGDQEAWRELVDRHSPTVWAVARAHRLNQADAADAVQNTWLAFTEKSHTIRNLAALPGWLATTARREALRIIAQHRRETPVEELRATELCWDGPESRAVMADRDSLLWRAFEQLPLQCRQVLRLLVHAPELTQAEIAVSVGLAPNSIAQTKWRCLQVLRRKAALIGLFEECGQ